MHNHAQLTALEKLVVDVVTLPHKTEGTHACELIDKWYLREKSQIVENFPVSNGDLLFSSHQVHLKDKPGILGANLYTFWGKSHVSGCINANQAEQNILFALGHLYNDGNHSAAEGTDPKQFSADYKHGFDETKFRLVRLAGSLDCYKKPRSPQSNATWEEKVTYHLNMLEHEAWKILKDDRKDAVAAMRYVQELKSAWRTYQANERTKQTYDKVKESFTTTIGRNQALLAKHRGLSLTTVNILSAIAVPYGLVCLGAAVWNLATKGEFRVPWHDTAMKRTSRSLDSALSQVSAQS